MSNQTAKPQVRSSAKVSSTLMLFGFLAGGCGISPEYRDIDEPAADRSLSSRNRAGDSVLGSWGGVGHQNDDADWQMELHVTSLEEGPCAIVRYPSLGCAGYWSCQHISGREILAREHITEGRDVCADNVRVRAKLSRAGSVLRFRARAGNIRAWGELTR